MREIAVQGRDFSNFIHQIAFSIFDRGGGFEEKDDCGSAEKQTISLLAKSDRVHFQCLFHLRDKISPALRSHLNNVQLPDFCQYFLLDFDLKIFHQDPILLRAALFRRGRNDNPAALILHKSPR